LSAKDQLAPFGNIPVVVQVCKAPHPVICNTRKLLNEGVCQDFLSISNAQRRANSLVKASICSDVLSEMIGRRRAALPS
jgi:hypothetical protein